MEIVRDESKRRMNVQKHGLDFADLREEFFDDAFVAIARHGRWKAIGLFQNTLIVAVVFTAPGSEAFSLISMRRASRSERRQYADLET